MTTSPSTAAYIITPEGNPVPNHSETPNQLKERERVQQWSDQLFRTSPMIRFMYKHLSLLDCNPLDPSSSSSNRIASGSRTTKDEPTTSNRSQGSSSSSSSSSSHLPPLLIASCPEGIAGGFNPSAPTESTSRSGILLCSNRIFSKSHLEDTLSHEMIHWWDHCRFKVDWSNLSHHACSEVRAASLSGDCRFFREVGRRNFGLTKQHQACVRRRAILSVMANPKCGGDEKVASKAVDEVWNSCFGDTRPFDEIY
ncbi:mitochondrial inner membrane protease ATP23 [Violaceomyces palustris]|uniref:Mitochondrial inner membrane protease ATP23 n=1 Tax=Violaceomyces palustris TaxID=1673888 RepID=A0ACD0NRL5_9BASI|nr:mitochondrial inner membrane protease ATP23 [Violaceomyces palustris]